MRVFHISDYYSANGQTGWLEQRGESRAAIGSHAGIRDTSELMAAFPDGVRRERLASSIGKGFPETGVVGDPRRASRKRGEAMIALKVRAAVAQIRALERAAGPDPTDSGSATGTPADESGREEGAPEDGPKESSRAGSKDGEREAVGPPG